eukprot:1714111-Prymnesium_polylepis.1
MSVKISMPPPPPYSTGALIRLRREWRGSGCGSDGAITCGQSGGTGRASVGTRCKPRVGTNAARGARERRGRRAAQLGSWHRWTGGRVSYHGVVKAPGGPPLQPLEEALRLEGGDTRECACVSHGKKGSGGGRTTSRRGISSRHFVEAVDCAFC